MTESSQPSHPGLDQLYEQALLLRDRIAAKLVLQDLNLEVEDDLKAFAEELIQVTAELTFTTIEEDHNSLNELRTFSENLVVFTRLLQQTAAASEPDIAYLKYLQSWFKDDVIGTVQQQKQLQQSDPQIAELPRGNVNIPPRPRPRSAVEMDDATVFSPQQPYSAKGQFNIPRRSFSTRKLEVPPFASPSGDFNPPPPPPNVRNDGDLSQPPINTTESSGGDVNPPPPPPPPLELSETPDPHREIPVEFSGGDFNPPPPN